MSATPNFLYIGTSKAGSTWIFKVLSWHPQIYMFPGKDLGFFTSNFDNGWEWYRRNFRPRPEHQVIGEVAHSYMVSEAATDRIHSLMPDAKLMVCLREPVQRIFSQYLDGLKNGKMTGTLEEELERTPSLINRSRYGTHMARYLEKFPRENVHFASFDELVKTPELFARRMFEFLGVDTPELPAKLMEKVLPAGKPRVRSLAMAAKAVARAAEQVGLHGLRGKAKTSPAVRNILYKPFTKESRPEMPEDIRSWLRNILAEEVQLLDRVAGTDFCERWGYPTAQPALSASA